MSEILFGLQNSSKTPYVGSARDRQRERQSKLFLQFIFQDTYA